MDSAFRQLCIEVLNDNILSQQFNELLLETGVSLDSSEWDVANKILERADEIMVLAGGKNHLLH
ncbi:MAG: hypothetical protein HY877_00375 [Deltaproteobacteria bacterium]|nr:hypothetical protein [Deltaproteobacteria bacterium]